MVDIPGDISTNRDVIIGSPIDDQLEFTGDHDWFRLSLTAGQKAVIAVNRGTLEDSYIYLRTATGALIAENDDGGGGRGSRLVYTAPTSGTYYVDVSAWVNDGSDPQYSD